MTTITNGNTSSNEAQQLRQEIEAQRSMLGRDLEALGDHVSPGRMVERRRNAATQRVRGMKDKLMGVADDTTSAVTGRASSAGSAITERAESVVQTMASAPDMAKSQTQGNPLAMGLISFGVGLVASSLIPATRQERQLARKAEPMLQTAAEQAGTLAREDVDQLVPAAKEAAMDLREDAADAARVVKEQAQAAAAEVQDQAKGSAEHVAEQAKGSGTGQPSTGTTPPNRPPGSSF
jgi:hypothetical protein